jgi:hypothetical protein
MNECCYSCLANLFLALQTGGKECAYTGKNSSCCTSGCLIFRNTCISMIFLHRNLVKLAKRKSLMMWIPRCRETQDESSNLKIVIGYIILHVLTYQGTLWPHLHEHRPQWQWWNLSMRKWNEMSGQGISCVMDKQNKYIVLPSKFCKMLWAERAGDLPWASMCHEPWRSWRTAENSQEWDRWSILIIYVTSVCWYHGKASQPNWRTIIILSLFDKAISSTLTTPGLARRN